MWKEEKRKAKEKRKDISVQVCSVPNCFEKRLNLVGWTDNGHIHIMEYYTALKLGARLLFWYGNGHKMYFSVNIPWCRTLCTEYFLF